LRFPVFIGAMTPEGAARLARAQTKLPAKTRDVIARFEADLDPVIVEDSHYEFRVHLVPKTGPKSEADLAVSFVRLDDLTEEQREVFAQLGRTGTVIVRERLREVSNAGKMKPGMASKQIGARIPFRFSVYSEFPRAWRRLDCRPPPGTDHPNQGAILHLRRRARRLRLHRRVRR
jgi:hypothetical protein